MTAKAESDLQTAQARVADHANQVATSKATLDREQQELERAKGQVAAESKSLAQKQDQLGAAQGAVGSAQTAYTAALTERLAKLDAGLAKLATKTDAASKDAFVGLAARRARIDPTAPTSQLDIALSAIEIDLHAAL